MESEFKQMKSFVLENVQPIDDVATNVKADDDADDGTQFVKAQFDGGIPKTNVLDTRQNNGHRDMGCDTDVSKCSLCMTHMDRLEKKMLTTTSHIANLEDVKSGSVESALMIKEEVFRSRLDISAWADKHFSESAGISIESGCFMTPYYLLNLIHWDMCSSSGKTELTVKDMKALGVKQADALAFFTLQSAKPEFMLTKEACPSHKQVCSKTIRDGASIKFIPSFADFVVAAQTLVHCIIASRNPCVR